MKKKEFVCKSCNKTLQVSIKNHKENYTNQVDCMVCREWKR